MLQVKSGANLPRVHLRRMLGGIVSDELQHATEGQFGGLRQDVAHSARMYDYYLGGKTNYEVDRQAAQEVISWFPAIRTVARVNRAFLHRSVRMLAREGVRQFLDIGTGIPTAPNIHEIVQAEQPQARVTYVDHDPIVLVYADALLRSSREGATSYVEADVREPAALIEAVRRDGCLDLDEPVALSLNAILHFVPDDQDAYGIVQSLLGELAPGSFLGISHCTPDFDPEAWEAIVGVYESAGTPVRVRSHEEVSNFFEGNGLELLEPGVTVAHQWRPEPQSGPTLISDAEASLYAGVARKM
jgi:hypothetical protein